MQRGRVLRPHVQHRLLVSPVARVARFGAARDLRASQHRDRGTDSGLWCRWPHPLKTTGEAGSSRCLGFVTLRFFFPETPNILKFMFSLFMPLNDAYFILGNDLGLLF